MLLEHVGLKAWLQSPVGQQVVLPRSNRIPYLGTLSFLKAVVGHLPCGSSMISMTTEAETEPPAKHLEQPCQVIQGPKSLINWGVRAWDSLVGKI